MTKINGFLWVATTSAIIALVFLGNAAFKIQTSSGTQGSPEVLGASTVLIRGANQADQSVLLPKIITPLDPASVSAKSFLVYDEASGAILGQKNSELELPIASLTKLMTGLVSYQSVNLNDIVTISPEDLENTKPSLGLVVGEKVLASDLFNAMLVGSCNDAAKALANYVASQTKISFVTSMNQQAKTLKMEQSSFSNPIGFDSDNNYSTASDLQKLVNAAEFYTAFSLSGKLTSYSFTSISGQAHRVLATNKLIGKDKEIYAVKTGFTSEALGAMITKVVHLGHSFIIIVVGSSDRETDTLQLKQQVIANINWPS